MFNQDFYPTPVEVIEQMMMGEDVISKVVLEPSAGSGNIVNWLNDHGAKEVMACEIEPRLRRMLGNTCRLIGEDFLRLESSQVVNLQYIVMNPPFSRAVDHLRHAWEIAPAGCTIVSIMPATVFSNMYSSDRKALRELINLHGNITNIGDAFRHAERTTDAQISIVKMYKEGTGENEFADYFFDQTDMDDQGTGVSGLMPYNALRDLVNRYKCAVERYDAVMKIADEINGFTNFGSMIPKTPESRNVACPNSIRFGAYWNNNNNDNPQKITRDVFKKQLKKDAWRFVFNLLDLKKYATNKLLQQIDLFIEQQSSVPFTMRNIYKMLDAVIQTNDQRMQTCLVDAFESICSFSYENSTAGEGWKTNSDYMVNRRFIIPYMAGYDSRFPTMTVKSNYSLEKWNKMEDVEKAMCFITGDKFPETYHDGIRYKFDNSNALWGEWFDCGIFFRCRAYKKGTVHFEFKDEDVWMKFNAAVAKAKGWNAIGTNSKNVKKKKKS